MCKILSFRCWLPQKGNSILMLKGYSLDVTKFRINRLACMDLDVWNWTREDCSEFIGMLHPHKIKVILFRNQRIVFICKLRNKKEKNWNIIQFRDYWDVVFEGWLCVQLCYNHNKKALCSCLSDKQKKNEKVWKYYHHF